MDKSDSLFGTGDEMFEDDNISGEEMKLEAISNTSQDELSEGIQETNASESVLSVEFIPSERMVASITYSSTKEIHDKSEQTEEVEEAALDGEEHKSEENMEEFETLFMTEEFAVPTPIDESEVDEENDVRVTFIDDNEEETIKIKVRFTTDGSETVTSIFNACLTIIEIKHKLAKVFRASVDDFKLTHEGVECDNQLKLYEYYFVPDSGVVEFGIQSTDTEKILAPGEFSRYVPVTRKLCLQIPRDVGDIKKVNVVVEDQCFIKEWLGGYRNKLNNLVYHHVRTQTLPRKRPPGSLPQFTRQTQTPCFPLKELALDTTKQKATQMWRSDHYVTSVYDKIVATDPGRFIPAKSLSSFYELVKIVVLCQRYCRNFLRKRAEYLENIRKQREIELEEAYRKYLRKMLLEDNRRLIIGGTFPITRDDFYQLYLALGKWWRKEQKKISQLKTSESKKAAFYELLVKETKLIRGIEMQRSDARKEIFLKQELKFISTCARPIIFRNQEGVMSSIDTVETQQSREQQEIVSSYINIETTKAERIDKLRTLILLLQSYNCYEYSEEIIKLLHRECDMLALDVRFDQLKTLRERVLQLILHNLHNPIVNPSCKNYKKPSMPKTYTKWHLCLHCNKVKPACDYNVHVKLIRFDCCYSCEWMKNISQDRMDLTPFIRILEHVRQAELKYCCKSANSYVLRPVGMRYLTFQIWRSKSLISDAENLNDIRFFRFYRDQDWTPWNCILLTLDEGKIHMSLDNVEEFYSPILLNKIRYRHMRARMHFVPLVLNDRYLDESKLWDHCQDTGKFLHPAHINKFAQTEDFEHFA